MKHFFYIVVFALSLCSVPLCAETSMSDGARSASVILPFSESYSYSEFSPVYIQLPGFSLTGDSGSLMHSLDINVTKLPYKGGTLMPSNMENVCRLSDGVRLLPNGQHVCVEFDTKSENGLKHQQTIQNNDPNAKVILKTVE